MHLAVRMYLSFQKGGGGRSTGFVLTAFLVLLCLCSRMNASQYFTVGIYG
jgi:hypothetical protein